MFSCGFCFVLVGSILLSGLATSLSAASYGGIASWCLLFATSLWDAGSAFASGKVMMFKQASRTPKPYLDHKPLL